MDSSLILLHHRHLNGEDGVEEKACRSNVAGAQADGATTVNPDPLNPSPRKASVYTKVPVPQTDTGG
jgi:hypothetical protein